MAFDDRIVKLVFTYGDEQVTIDTSQMDPKRAPMIYASGTKFADVTQNECTVQIGNLRRETRNALATNLTPVDYNNVRKTMQVWAGRVSTGMFLRYEGDIISGIPSQPPDIVMTLRSKTMYWYKQDVLAQSYAVSGVAASRIAADTAKTMGLQLNFQATDRNVSNYSYSGNTAGQIEKLANVGGFDAYVDDNTLVCKNKGTALANATFVLSSESGMVGQVELTEWGVRVKCMLTPDIKLGGTLTIQSTQNPSLNGSYTIYRTGFEIATRDTPFYDVIEATRYPAAFYSAVLPV